MTKAADRGPPRGPMRRSWLAPLVVAALALGSSGCGATIQYMYGFTERDTRTATRTRSIRVKRPNGVRVERVDADGKTTQIPGAVDLVTYEVEETIEVPRSMVPMYIGTGLDLLAVAGFGWALSQTRDDDAGPTLAYGLGYAVAAFIGDLAFSFYYSSDREPEVVAYAPVAPKPTTYFGYLGDETRRARIDATMKSEVDLDFARPADLTDAAPTAPNEPIEPGGPRLTEPEPAFHAATTPKPPPEESWYGWQLLPLDILSVSTLIYAAKEQDYRLASIAGTIHVLSGPTIHLAHGRYETGGGSLGLRVGPAAAAAAMGGVFALLLSPIVYLYDSDFNLFEFVGTAAAYFAAYGFVIGAPVVAILDAAVLGWEPTEAEEPAVLIVPTAGRTDDGHATFGLGGRF